jgi:hypothetical protein
MFGCLYDGDDGDDRALWIMLIFLCDRRENGSERAHETAVPMVSQTISLLCISSLPLGLITAASSSPNILLFFPDEFRYDWGGLVNNPYYEEDTLPLHTPHFDWLATTGTRFTRAFVPAVVWYIVHSTYTLEASYMFSNFFSIVLLYTHVFCLLLYRSSIYTHSYSHTLPPSPFAAPLPVLVCQVVASTTTRTSRRIFTTTSI